MILVIYGSKKVEATPYNLSSLLLLLLFFFFVGTYYTVAIFEIGLAIAATCIVLNFHHRKTKMPRWMKVLMLEKLASVLMIDNKKLKWMKEEKLNDHEVGQVYLENQCQSFENTCICNGTELGFASSNEVHLESVKRNEDNGDERSVGLRSDETPSDMLNGEPCRSHNTPVKKPETTQRKSMGNPMSHSQALLWQEEWQTTARVLDRFIIIFAVVIGCASAVGIFLQAPRVREYFNLQ